MYVTVKEKKTTTNNNNNNNNNDKNKTDNIVPMIWNWIFSFSFGEPFVYEVCNLGEFWYMFGCDIFQAHYHNVRLKWRFGFIHIVNSFS